MVQYGNTDIPGVISDVETNDSVGVPSDAPADVGIIGQYDPTTGTATANTVYEIYRTSKARTLFGDGEHLTEAVIDALQEGVSPVYAMTPARQTVSAEDISALASTSGTLTNAPVSENAEKTTFTVDGTAKTTIITLNDPSHVTPAAGEVYLNPVTGAFELDAVPADASTTNDSVAYEYYDYAAAITAFGQDERAVEAVDFLGLTTENQSVVSAGLTEVKAQATNYNFMILLAGAGIHITPSSYLNTYDSSRLQLVYPTRNDTDESLIGSYAGRRAKIGITTSPINKRLKTQTSLRERLSIDQQKALLAEQVVPLTSESRGSKIVDDPTCVTTAGSEEAGMNYGLARLVMDVVTETVKDNEEPFIGKFNNKKVLKKMENIIGGRLKFLLNSEAIISYSLVVEKISATEASVDVGVVPVAPLRTIRNTISAGN